MSRHYWLSCHVAPGMFFPHEYAISGYESNGAAYELFVPEEQPGQFVKAPPGHEGQGKILVELVNFNGDLARVQLPQHTLTGGPYITVRRSDLSPADPPNVAQPA